MGECLLARHGGTRYVVGSYVGNGATTKRKLSLGFQPKIVIIQADDKGFGISTYLLNPAQNASFHVSSSNYVLQLEWIADG